MDDFVSDTDSDYTSYWRDWVSAVYDSFFLISCYLYASSVRRCSLSTCLCFLPRCEALRTDVSSVIALFRRMGVREENAPADPVRPSDLVWPIRHYP